LRKLGEKPVVGDMCLITGGAETGKIEKILDRKNIILRPAVSNIDAVVAIISADMLNLPLLDMYLVALEAQQTENAPYEICVVINKMDLSDDDKNEITRRAYENAGYRVIFFSARSRRGEAELAGAIRGKTAVMAGPSGVGKSSVINLLCKRQAMPVGELSVKSVRGKHTTRHAEMFEYMGGYIIDTPGFASLNIGDIGRERLKNCFPEFARYAENCRFADCTHVNEPDCAVKGQVGEGVGASRYGNYEGFYNAVK